MDYQVKLAPQDTVNFWEIKENQDGHLLVFHYQIDGVTNAIEHSGIGIPISIAPEALSNLPNMSEFEQVKYLYHNHVKPFFRSIYSGKPDFSEYKPHMRAEKAFFEYLMRKC